MPVPTVSLEYIAAGGNRHPSAADWAPGLLAFGAGNNVALWDPDENSHKGVFALLTGHTDVVNAIKIFDGSEGRCIITGSVDKTIRVWTQFSAEVAFEESQCLSQHEGSVNTISILPQRHAFATGSADGMLKTWEFSGLKAQLLQSIPLKPRYLPLTSALIELNEGVIVLAVAGTSNSIQLYIRTKSDADFVLQATLVGHESWIRSLDFKHENFTPHSDIILASASQDKYIRLWRFHKSSDTFHPITNGSPEQTLATPKKSLSNRAQQVGGTEDKYNVTFEALLIGHEDWIYTVQWAPRKDEQSGLKLLSASADNSLAIWSPDESSGVWFCHTRLGEISAQKGSTTATGSAGGFWAGLWQPSGQSVVSLGRTGSWRRWCYQQSSDMWIQQIGISGHTQEVRSLAWAPNGSYLITTSSDQTTRLFAEWKRDRDRSWHEFARPQIHGYDLNCIDTMSQSQFISGADEKLLRVFNKPKAIARLLAKLCGSQDEATNELPDAANIPVLGLSNKAIAHAPDEEIQANDITQHDLNGHDTVDPSSIVHVSTLEIDHPPLEDHLSRHTLWPEHEKLYGHGYEISAVTASHDGSIVATACKASSLEHAVIRLYECREWREIKPTLTAHSLTVTALAFSSDDRYLLSVGRDRQWSVFARSSNQSNEYELLMTNPKGHSRMILACSWAPREIGFVFTTAGRDKNVNIWKRTHDGTIECIKTITEETSVTAIAIRDSLTKGILRLAMGTENGYIRIVDLRKEDLEIVCKFGFPKPSLPSSAINALSWRPNPTADDSHAGQLAVASDDTSLRIFNIPL